MNFKGLRAFTLVMEIGSLTAAASQMRLSASAVSRLIAQLESETKLKLFDRLHRGLVPTEAGRLFVKEAQRILSDLEDLPIVVEKIRHGTFQRLRVLTTPRLIPGLVVPSLSLFSARHRSVKCLLDVQPKWDLERSLATHRYDIGIAILPVLNSAMTIRPLFRIRSELLLPQNHRLVQADQIEAKDLVGETLIGFLPGQLIRRQFNELSYQTGIELDFSIETSNSAVAAELVNQGCGLTMGDRMLLHGLRLDNVAARPVHPPAWTTAGLLLPPDMNVGAHTEAFIACLVETLEKFARTGDNQAIIEIFTSG